MFFEFLGEQALLIGALLSCIFLLLFHENRRAGQSLTPTQLSQLVNSDNALVVDVRPADEYRAGHIVDAINIPHTDFEKRAAELEKHKERPVILVCKLGQSSSSAGKMLAGKGFEKVYRLGGGMMEWTTSQLPLVKGQEKGKEKAKEKEKPKEKPKSKAKAQD